MPPKHGQFTIISNNCWGAGAYHEADLPYQTPFVGLWILGPDYIKLLRNLKEYLFGRIDFTNVSRYVFVEEGRKSVGGAAYTLLVCWKMV
jgi:uncharacterized protein (DUF1919 family)